jgi:hypothetical protein
LGDDLLYKSLSRGINSVHRIASGDRLEVGQWCVDREREVLSATQRDSYVLSEDGCPLLRRHWHEVNAASASLTDNGVTMRRLDIFHPIRFRAQHRTR